MKPLISQLLASQLFRFAQVGAAGFVVDWLCLSFFLWLGTGFLIGRGLSYFCAATATWAMNRIWTFANTDESRVRQWARFLAANAVGGSINYGASAILAIRFPDTIGPHPIIAVAVGSLSGLIVNFGLSRRFVFGSGSTS